MLYPYISGVRTLSVIGMCKNAGKTTVLNSLISECEARGEILGLTSIGRDGERSDLVTNTKKPEIFVRAGAIVATAEDLLREGDISMEILDSTGVPTPMGEIIIVRATASGFVQIGGASITAHQRLIRDKLFAFGCDRVFIDGAISRKSLGNPSLADASILSSGASYDPSVARTAEDTAYYARLFSLPQVGMEPTCLRFTAESEGERFGSDELDGLAKVIRSGASKLMLRGAVTDSTAKALLAYGKLLGNTTLIAEDASRLLLKPDSFEKLLRFTKGFGVLKGTRLAAVTVNPFSAYGLHYDKNEFKERVESALQAAGLDIPVFDVKDA
ncbi:MAG: hypothetical protein IKG85_02690 [Clostridia bacterium]|nr:hypothetical protein [Clostridia bacterium]